MLGLKLSPCTGKVPDCSLTLCTPANTAIVKSWAGKLDSSLMTTSSALASAKKSTRRQIQLATRSNSLKHMNLTCDQCGKPLPDPHKVIMQRGQCFCSAHCHNSFMEEVAVSTHQKNIHDPSQWFGWSHIFGEGKLH